MRGPDRSEFPLSPLPGGAVVSCGFLEQNRGDQDAVAETAWEFVNVKSGSKLAATLAEEAI